MNSAITFKQESAGNVRFSNGKTLAGTLAAITVCIAVTGVYIHWHADMWHLTRSQQVAFSLVGGLVGTTEIGHSSLQLADCFSHSVQEVYRRCS
jgi:dolichol kinase